MPDSKLVRLTTLLSDWVYRKGAEARAPSWAENITPGGGDFSGTGHSLGGAP